jgi:selenocysteine-specific elongation factor
MRHIVIGTAGHIDHGKSALVRALTGTDPDRLKEEKARGITIDLGFAHYEAGETSVAFVDVPGHERFVKNMLAGVGGIDGVLLVIAADESVMPQTREHFDICRLLGIRSGVVALTKADLVDEETLELVRLETRDLVSGSFLEDAPLIAVSSKTGQGLDRLRQALEELAGTTAGRRSDGIARLPVDRVFSIRGFGTVVTGTLVSGSIASDQELEVLPRGETVKVRGVQVHGRAQVLATAGQRVAVNLGGVEVTDLGRGDTLSTPGALESTRRFDAWLELLPGAPPLKHGARIRFHQGTVEVLGRIGIAAGGAGGDDGPGEIAPGGGAGVRVRLEAPAVLARGDRFIIRAYSPAVTIGGGDVLDPRPPRIGIRTPAGARWFDRIGCGREGDRPDRTLPAPAGSARAAHGSEDATGAVAAMVEDRGAQGFPLSALISRAGVPPLDVPAFVDGLVASGTVVLVGSLLVPARSLRDLRERLLRELEGYHRLQPLSEGLPREEARERLFRRADPAVFERLIADLVSERSLVAGDRLALASHRVSLSPEEERAKEALETLFRTAGLKPPDPSALAASIGIGRDVTDRMLKLLLRQKVLARVDDLVFHVEALQRLKNEVVGLKRERGAEARVDVASFKDRYGISRKFAIPLLEYLDRERVTRRVGETRRVL